MKTTLMTAVTALVMAIGLLAITPAGSASAASCVQQIRVWYDADQYGSYAKAWGEVANCYGPRTIRVDISCVRNGTLSLRYRESAYGGTYFQLGTTKTTLKSIGTCKGGYFNGVVSGSYAGRTAYTKYFRWYDGGYPV